MSTRIFKYPLAAKPVQILLLPVGAQILTIQNQVDNQAMTEGPQLWAIVDPSSDVKMEREIEMIETGVEMMEHPGKERKFIATFQVMRGHYVLHAFELLKKR